LEQLVVITKNKSESLELALDLASIVKKLKILLLGDSAFMISNPQHLDKIHEVVKAGTSFYFLSNDAKRRGLDIISASIIDYNELVDMLFGSRGGIINM
jgi:sulfur transfer complex TusBCD TusB component (DsrH family)